MMRCWIILAVLLAAAFHERGEASAQESAAPALDAATAAQKSALSIAVPGLGGGAFLPDRDKGSPPRYVQSGNIIIWWSEKGDVAWGYSKAIGSWTRQEIDPPCKPAPVLGDSVGMLASGNKVFAYSGQTGQWGVLELPKDAKPNGSWMVEGDLVLIPSGNRVHTFSGHTGKWGTQELPADARPEWVVSDGLVLLTWGDKVYTFSSSSGVWITPETNAESRYGRSPTYSESKPAVSPNSAFRIFPLQHVESAEMQGVLEQVMPSIAFTLAPNSNALVANVPVEQIEALDAMIHLLDQPPSARPNSERESGTHVDTRWSARPFRLQHIQSADMQDLLQQLRPADVIRADTTTNTLMVRAPKGVLEAIASVVERLDQPPSASAVGLDASTGEHKRAYQALENEAADLALNLRQSDPTTDAARSLRKRLTDVVAQTFAARQRLQQAEVAEMTEKLDRVKQQIAERERLKQQIIDRRVEELLAPAPKWDPPAN